jgi:F-type H+-transporting ATPase subunit gamma
MANLKDIKNRIGSVKKTRQITKAMKLVAAAKLKRATSNAMAARPYREQLSGVLQRVAGAAGDDLEEPLLKPRQGNRILAVVLTSDRGLCGPFNNGLLRKAHEWVEGQRASGKEVSVRVYGRKARDFFRARKIPLADITMDYAKKPKMDLVRPITDHMVAGFLDGTYDQVVFIYNRFVNTLVQVPAFDTVLPLSVKGNDKDAERLASGEYRYEPDAKGIISNLLPLYLRTLVLQVFLETEAGEHAARMTAMDNASRNAGDLITSLTLDFNRARQAAITTEIIEITSGAAAL